MQKPIRVKKRAEVSLYFCEMLEFSLFWYSTRILCMGGEVWFSLLSLISDSLVTLGFFYRTVVELGLPHFGGAPTTGVLKNDFLEAAVGALAFAFWMPWNERDRDGYWLNQCHICVALETANLLLKYIQPNTIYGQWGRSMQLIQISWFKFIW